MSEISVIDVLVDFSGQHKTGWAYCTLLYVAGEFAFCGRFQYAQTKEVSKRATLAVIPLLIPRLIEIQAWAFCMSLPWLLSYTPCKSVRFRNHQTPTCCFGLLAASRRAFLGGITEVSGFLLPRCVLWRGKTVEGRTCFLGGFDLFVYPKVFQGLTILFLGFLSKSKLKGGCMSRRT